MVSVPDETMDWLRIGTRVRQLILEKLDSESCSTSSWAPRPDALAKHPWSQSPTANINGEVDTENHKILYNNSVLAIANVYASHQEQFHSHRALSIFVVWGIDICQDNHKYDGTFTHAGAANCAKTYNATMPKTLRVIFMSTEWLHANVLYKSMNLLQSPNCPHHLAPDQCDGFMIRFVFHDNAPARVYPLDPLRAPVVSRLVV